MRREKEVPDAETDENSKVNRTRGDGGVMDIDIRAEVYPTEDPGSVERAIMNLFPGAIKIEDPEPQLLVMSADDARAMAERIAKQRIRDTARSVLLRSIRGGVLMFHLNKQAAYCGKVNFTDGESLLGDIAVTIGNGDPRELVESLTGVGD